MWEREGESQVDIVDGDNAAEIAGEQRGLMMSLLASERASERIERAGQGTFSLSLLHSSVSLFLFLSYSLLLVLHRPHHTTCVVLRIKLILSTLQTLMKTKIINILRNNTKSLKQKVPMMKKKEKSNHWNNVFGISA